MDGNAQYMTARFVFIETILYENWLERYLNLFPYAHTHIHTYR